MPKNLPILPAQVRKPGTLEPGSIPLNAYRASPTQEAARFGRDGLLRMYRDMTLIREFETMLQRVKLQGGYEGVACEHKGPCHLSIGQEAAAVGMAWPLGAEDLVFGSHRSHGEILAKCLSAIEKLPEADLPAILEGYGGGRTLRAIEGYSRGTPREVAMDYVLYGTLAEILGRDAGFNRGMGGSMHAFFPPFGVMPNNAIVGGSADIAAGAALFKRVNRKGGVVIANIGDAAAGCGPVWEAMIFSAMDQYRTLWDPALGGSPPILFNFMNNFYGMGGQTFGETMGFGILARMGAGVNPEGMHAERVDGYNPLAVADAVERKMKLLREGKGPALLDTVTYRISGHSPSDASSYRDRHEVERWQQADSIAAFGAYLVANGHCTQADLDASRMSCAERVLRALRQAAPEGSSPRMPAEGIGGLMFSYGTAERTGEGISEVTVDPAGNPRLSTLAGKSRSGLLDGVPVPKARAVNYADALFEAMLHRFREDPAMIAYGEENRDWGGAFSVYRGLTECLPYHRLFNAPISEGAITGTAVGYALSGGRAVAEIMYCDFLGRAGDEVFNQMAKWQAMSGGALRMPLVLRVSVGSKYGAQHSQDWTSLVAHIPGLRVMFPATPYDAKGMLNLALRGTDPVVFFESQRLYAETELFAPGGVPEGYYEVEMGAPALRREGRDVTLVTLGSTLYRALEAAELLESRYGVSAEVIDVRFVNPLDYGPILESVRKTGAAVLASDACERGSFLHTMASRISQAAFADLDAPVTVLGARNWITPPAEMETSFFPQKEWFLDAIDESIRRLPGHIPATRQGIGDFLERDRTGT
ncbi:MAG: putative pyruvate dehydrogenase component alpha subunit/beta subunit [Fibrobacteres bacterium]|nr:putative pyruvate dehydrogenase component alpha subunit/beta subunit [Fibrobacterota bacterium]